MSVTAIPLWETIAAAAVPSILIVFGALAVDMIWGDPKSRYHPTAWAGGLMARMVPRLAGRSRRAERAGGIVMVMAVVACVVGALLLLSLAIKVTLPLAPAYNLSFPWHIQAYEAIRTDLAATYMVAAYMIISCILLKCTIAVRGMQEHARAIAVALRDDNNGSMAHARNLLSMIVKRQTGSLDREHVVSGTIESVGEGTSDGITGPLFYFGLAGLPGAFAYRVANTADSMVGYKNKTFENIGWFAAHTDTILSYLPARLTGVCMVGAAFALRYDWRSAWRIMIRDGAATQSRNSGRVMAAMAGALGVRLEKEGEYTLHSEGESPDVADVYRAIALMRGTAALFAAAVCVPLMAPAFLLSLAASIIVWGGIKL